jgi:hypothetical protein
VGEFPSKEGWRAAAFESIDPSRLTLPPQPEQVRINHTKTEAAPTLHIIMQILGAKIMNTMNSICRRHRQEADDMSKKSNNIDI